MSEAITAPGATGVALIHHKRSEATVGWLFSVGSCLVVRDARDNDDHRCHQHQKDSGDGQHATAQKAEREQETKMPRWQAAFRLLSAGRE